MMAPISSWQFIYGVGTQGLCLFEKALYGKKTGEETFFPLNPPIPSNCWLF